MHEANESMGHLADRRDNEAGGTDLVSAVLLFLLSLIKLEHKE